MFDEARQILILGAALRVAGVVFLAPFLPRGLPGAFWLRLGLATLLGLVLAASLRAPVGVTESIAAAPLSFLVTELSVGLFIGGLVLCLVAGARAGARLVARELGLRDGGSLGLAGDPLTRSSEALSPLLALGAILVFYEADLHLFALEIVTRSLAAWPVGELAWSALPRFLAELSLYALPRTLVALAAIALPPLVVLVVVGPLVGLLQRGSRDPAEIALAATLRWGLGVLALGVGLPWSLPLLEGLLGSALADGEELLGVLFA